MGGRGVIGIQPPLHKEKKCLPQISVYAPNFIPPNARAYKVINLGGGAKFARSVFFIFLESQNQAIRTSFLDLQSSPIKIWGKLVKWFLSYDRTNKQTNRNYNFIYNDNLFGT